MEISRPYKYFGDGSSLSFREMEGQNTSSLQLSFRSFGGFPGSPWSGCKRSYIIKKVEKKFAQIQSLGAGSSHLPITGVGAIASKPL